MLNLANLCFVKEAPNISIMGIYLKVTDCYIDTRLHISGHFDLHAVILFCYCQGKCHHNIHTRMEPKQIFGFTTNIYRE